MKEDEAEVDVAGWRYVQVEELGSKPDKRWLEDDAKTRWLFKPVTFHHVGGELVAKGDDWAEKVVADIAALLQVPAAHVELARLGNERGVISRSVSAGGQLALGNEVLADLLPDYPKELLHGVDDYTVETIYGALRHVGAAPPPNAPPDVSAVDVMAGYLILDALVSNTDRHHQNWGVVVTAEGGRYLASSFDHASSLGFQLLDRERQDRLGTRDANRTVEAWVRQGRSRHMTGSPTFVAVALEAAAQAGPRAADWFDRIEALSSDAINAVLDRVPPGRMSQASRTFVLKVLEINRRRLLDEHAHGG